MAKVRESRLKRTRDKEKDKAEGRIFKIILIGIALIFLVSLIEGFGPAFTHLIVHLQQDLKEWLIHFYILGWVLVIYGFYKLSRK